MKEWLEKIITRVIEKSLQRQANKMFKNKK